jgi:hypothetical protein
MRAARSTADKRQVAEMTTWRSVSANIAGCCVKVIDQVHVHVAVNDHDHVNDNDNISTLAADCRRAATKPSASQR